MSTAPGLSKPWRWIQPQGTDEILARLRDAFDLNVHERERENMCSVAHAEIVRLRETAERFRWIPVSELLPDDDVCVLIALDDGEVWTGYCTAGEWLYVSGDTMAAKVTAWCHLPPFQTIAIDAATDAERMDAGFGAALALTERAVK